MISKLAALRQKKGLAVAEIADRLDIPPDCWIDIEEGRRRLTPETLEEVASILGVAPQDLLGDEQQNVSVVAGYRLRQLRESRGLSLNELANKCGVSAAHLSELERAASGGSLKTWQALADVLGIKISFFFQETKKESIGQKLRRLRISRNLTQKQLAALVGVSYSLVAQIESGKVQPAISTLTKLARQLGVSPCYLLTEDQSESSDSILAQTLEQRPILKQLFQKLCRLEDGELIIFQELADQLLTAKSKLGLNTVSNSLASESQVVD